MKKKIEIIFTKEFEQFKKGQKKMVALGYARNFLFPKQLAIESDSKLGKRFSDTFEKEKAESKDLHSNYQEIFEKLNNKKFDLKKVTKKNLAEKIKKQFNISC